MWNFQKGISILLIAIVSGGNVSFREGSVIGIRNREEVVCSGSSIVPIIESFKKILVSTIRIGPGWLLRMLSALVIHLAVFGGV